MFGSGTQSSGFSFGNSGRPNIFGNSQSNGQTTNNALSGAQSTVQQPQQSTNPYGINIASASLQVSEMPQALTPSRKDEDVQLKRKRSTSSMVSHENTGSSLSFLNRLTKPFSGSQKYPIESSSGIFTSEKPHEIKRTKVDPAGLAETNGSVPKSEYRKLTIRNPRGTFKNFYEINPDEVILGKQHKGSNGFMHVVSSFKPSFLQKDTKTARPITQSESEQTSKPSNPEGYWSTPTISELANMSATELTHVENFTVGCKGLGQISFAYAVDLSAFHDKLEQLLGVYIVFRPRIVQVYPDGVDKPSPGNGMNVPAVVSVENCFPYDKATKSRITDPSAPEVPAHISRLKANLGMQFISYYPLTGTYTFRVEHFSIWGLVDEDEDDPELVQRFKEQMKRESELQSNKTLEQQNALDRISIYTGDQSSVPGGWGTPDEDESMEDSVDVEKEEFIEIEKPESEQESIGIEDEVLPQEEAFDELVQVRAYEPELEDIDMMVLKKDSNFETSESWDQQLSIANGFKSVFSNDYEYSKNMDLSAKSVNQLFFDNHPTKRKRVEHQPAPNDSLKLLRSILANEIRSMKVVLRSNSYPLIKPDDNVALRSILSVYKGTNEYKVWDLISRIFDDGFCESFHGQAERDACLGKPKLREVFIDLQRRELLIDWLQQYNFAEISKLISESTDSLETIFLQVCSGDLGKAVKTAMDTSNGHLSVLLTLIDSNDPSVRKFSKSQLVEWEKTSMLQYIPIPILKIYKLLAGEIFTNTYVRHLDGLSWSTVLLLQLKYGDTNRTISELVAEVFKNESKLTVHPDTKDKYYSTFKLLTSPLSVIDNYSHETQFLLFKKLNSVLQLPGIDGVILELSKKMNAQKYDEESLFLLEHLSDDKVCETEISALIKQNIDSFRFLDNDLRLDTLHETYRLPKSVLHKARSTKYEKEGESLKAVWSLVDAGAIEEAHKLTLTDVAPDYVIANTNFDELEQLLEKFQGLSDWIVGGELYYNYIQLKQKTDDSELKNYVKKLLNGLVLLREPNAKTKIAKVLMYREVIRLIFDLSLEYNKDQLLGLDLPSSEMNYLKSRLPTI
ncbi:hypothetical protein OGAPHI_003442 [Ogataea philodendri]|uniref:Peptidase S59 domain-containing protein n=1 Tax=Ogataea philodendri TaxID=1378263 RepID=A0A9P8P7F0_9ASCO|nr:uncharacterized protein OGAPHI_003442 [Ogataea philodendri]KAH3666446.1 hypothetical protein OGAPHI_003442 [Ogataea philodendri]